MTDSTRALGPQFDDTGMFGRRSGDPDPAREDEITVAAVGDSMDTVLDFVNRRLEAAGCRVKEQIELDVAVEEIFVNIISYAYDPPGTGSATIRMWTDAQARSTGITFIDSGKAFDPLQKPDPDITLPASKRKIGGLGIFMVKKSMDEVRYSRANGRNIFTMIKRW